MLDEKQKVELLGKCMSITQKLIHKEFTTIEDLINFIQSNFTQEELVFVSHRYFLETTLKIVSDAENKIGSQNYIQ